MSKQRGPNLKSKLLCPKCGNLQKVTAIDEAVIHLQCGHQRPGYLLPVKEGHLSIEHLRTKAGKDAFPGSRDGELTTRPEFDEWRNFKWR